MKATRDIAVIIEWQRRRSAYATRSAWLRMPFYGSLVFCFLGPLFLPPTFRLYVAAAVVVILLLIGVYLSVYSYSSLACPHCGKRPFNVYDVRIAHDHCRKCGYWLEDLPETANTSRERAPEK